MKGGASRADIDRQAAVLVDFLRLKTERVVLGKGTEDECRVCSLMRH